MCGICGIVGLKQPGRAEAAVRQMMARMVHRGPDDGGLFVDRSLALGVRRLSIVDLTGGRQPVFNEDGTLAVVFNGEIYNFHELRRTLECRGHAFRTHSDTEAIVHAYEEWGLECVHHLEGMFVFAVAETSKCAREGARRILVARDRLGIKPFYYSLAGSTLLFASEVRALLASGHVAPRLSLPGLRSYLLFGSVSEPMTLVEGVFSLPPGHRMLIRADGSCTAVSPEPYWDFARCAQPASALKMSERKSATSVLRSLMEETVQRHLIADVPLGLFLSSGIDSASLVALATRAAKVTRGESAVHTVTVVFPEQEFSEAEIARRTAERFRTHHQELLLSGEDMVERMGQAVSGLDQPTMDGINTYFVSWAARQAGLKVALSGLGGDEIFGGYGTFRQTPRAAALAAVASRVPGPLRSFVASTVENISRGRGRHDARRKLLALWRDPNNLPHPYFYARLLFTPAQVSELLSKDGILTPSEPWRNWLVETARGAEQLDNFAAVSCLEARTYMASTLLRDTDAMSMAHSLEVRVPFLDHRLIEFVSRLPASMKRNSGLPKTLLVNALADELPREVVAQRKRTFTLPWERWLRSTLCEQVAEGLTDIAPSLRQALDADGVRRVWADFLEGRTSWSRPWSLFVLNEWAKRHLTQN